MFSPRSINVRLQYWAAPAGVALVLLLLVSAVCNPILRGSTPLPPGGNSGQQGGPANPEKSGCFTPEACGPWTVTVPGNGVFQTYNCTSANLSAIGSQTTSGGDSDNGQLCGSYPVLTTYNGVPFTQVIFCGFDEPGSACGS